MLKLIKRPFMIATALVALLAVSASGVTIPPVLPGPITTNIRIPVINTSTGSAFTVTPDQIADYAENSATAVSAAASATAASSSATTADAKATNAAVSAAAAASSAVTANTAATNATSSATAAATSASSAQTYQTGAQTAATSATSSATSATASKNAAATSSTAAATSATNAGASAGTASSSASAASTSATTATTAASNASASASAAATSAGSAASSVTSASNYASSASGYASSASSSAASADSAANRYAAQYTLKVDSNGKVAGIGLFSDSTLGSTINMAAGAINLFGGKTSSTDTSTGYYLGTEGGVAKFSIGNAASWLKWDGTNLNYTGAVNGDRTIHGTIYGAGGTNIESGTGFTVAYTALGHYQINFTTPFATGSQPTCIVNPLDARGYTAYVTGYGAGYCQFSLYVAGTSTLTSGDRVSFIAVGTY